MQFVADHTVTAVCAQSIVRLGHNLFFGLALNTLQHNQIAEQFARTVL